MKILHIDSSILGPQSASREVSAAVVGALRRRHSAATVHYRDLAVQPPGHLDIGTLGAMNASDPSTLTPALREAAAFAETLLQEFIDADVVVIGAPMYNFAIPTQLKAWIDRISRAGRTFRYTDKGPEGLAVGKRVIIASSRGGAYAGQAFETALDHQEAYLRAVFGFVGITDVRIVRAEGTNMGDAARAAGIKAALEDAGKLGG